MKDDYTTNSHYLLHTFLFQRLGEFTFLSLGVKGLILLEMESYRRRLEGMNFSFEQWKQCFTHSLNAHS